MRRDIKPKAFRPPADWAHRGEMTRVVLTILRQAVEPLTARDIALEMLVTRALDRSDQRLLGLMTKRVGVALRNSARQRYRAFVSGAGPIHVVMWPCRL